MRLKLKEKNPSFNTFCIVHLRK